MPRLSNGDRHLSALREVVVRCVENDSANPLSEELLVAIRDLVGCDEVLFGGRDSVQRNLYFDQSSELGVTTPPGTSAPDPCEALLAEFGPSVDEPFPIPVGVPSVTKISDFLSLRQWHTTREYLELQGPDGEHRLQMVIPDGPGRELQLVCWRGPGKDFDEEDRWDLTMLMPHIEAAYRRQEHRRTTPSLTPRQQELLQLVSQGWTNYQIARRLRLSEGTVRTHLVNMYARLGVRSRTEAVTRVLMHTPEPATVPVSATKVR